MRPDIHLLVAKPIDPATGAERIVRLARGGTVGFTQLGTTDWMVGLDRPPALTQSLGYDNGMFGDGAAVQAAELAFKGQRADVAALAALYWPDAPFTLYSGPDGASDAQLVTIMQGRIRDISANGEQATLQMADPAADLAKPILADSKFTGKGGIEGIAELEGRPKRRAWGRCYNVELWSLDPANNIWVATDPAKPLHSFVNVYDKGNAASSLSVVAWAGTTAATFDALKAAVVPQGGAAVAPSIGCIKWWYPKSGKLTCDLRGEIGSAYVDRPADIAVALSLAAGGPAADAAALVAARAACNHEAGVLIDSLEASIASEIGALLSGVGLWWAMTGAGLIEMGEWSWAAPTTTIKAVTATTKKTNRAVPELHYGWRRNYSQMGRGEIAEVLFAGDVLYPDGSNVADTLAVTLSLARAKGKLWTGVTRPSLAQSNVGDTWIDPATGLFYERVSATGILLNGTVIMVNGKRPVLGWMASTNQPIAPILATAQEAYSDANAAIDALIDLADDGILSVHEKISVLIPEQARLEAKWAVLLSQASGMGVSVVAASSARSNWNATLAAILPAWNNVSADSPVNRTAFRSTRDAFDAALYDLDKAIKAAAATLANWSGIADDNGKRPADGATRNMARGTYSGSVEYLPGDSVVWPSDIGGTGHGYTRIGTGGTTGVDPSDGSKWVLSAQAASGGPAGPAGDSLFIWRAWADSADGTVNFSTTDPGTRGYLGLAFNRTTATSSTDPEDYVWQKTAGAQGPTGAQGLQGLQGPQGIQGPTGANGQPTYIWVAYADSADGTVNFTNGSPGARTYMGVAPNKTVATESANPADYSWSKIQGPVGPQGIAGIDGTDFEWVFLRSVGQPAAPVGNGIPAPWSDDIPPDDGRPLWMSGARKLINGDLKPGETWLAPVPFAENQMTLLVPSLAAATNARVGQQVMLPDGSLYRRIAGTGILLNGKVITLNSKRPSLKWVLEGQQPIWDVRNEAQNANQRAEEAIDLANEIVTRLASIDDDGILTIDEKIRTLIPLNAELESAYSVLVAAADDIGTGHAAADAARAAWLALRNAVSPAWDNIAADSAIGRGSWDATLLAYRNELDALRRAISEGAAPRQEPSAVSLKFKADWQGVLLSEQLPATISIKRLRGTTDVSSEATWAIVSQNGISGVTVTVSSGVVTIPDGASIQTGAAIIVKSTRDGIDIESRIDISKENAPPPNTGGGGTGGGTTQYDTSLNSMSSAAWVAISDVMTVKTGPLGKMDFAGVLDLLVSASSTNAQYPVEMKWKWRAGGGSWAESTIFYSSPSPRTYEEVQFEPYAESGSINVAHMASGLTASADYEVMLEGRRGTTIHTKTVAVSGTASAKGS